VQHYQHLLGYELRHVVHPHAGRLVRKRRLVASFVVVAAVVAAIAPRAAASPVAPSTLKPAASHQALQAAGPDRVATLRR
jgi:hypothetical protein